ncbi:hypothetical protein AcW1_009352 [Taiwanofungus camphoratus]|nr:hypothetical protein AcW1_009352 [Antrodia cinnamomea]
MELVILISFLPLTRSQHPSQGRVGPHVCELLTDPQDLTTSLISCAQEAGNATRHGYYLICVRRKDVGVLLCRSQWVSKHATVVLCFHL